MRMILRWGLMLMLLAAPAAASEPALLEADARHAAGGLEDLEAALDLYAQARQAAPGDYATLWKSARAHRDYANRVKQEKLPDWKAICKTQGKIAMQLAEQAVALAPERVEGHYYYGLSVGIYSDGVSILTALSEGLKDKTQTSFEKAYALDKHYNRAGPILSLGRFWTVLPWPLHDRPKALKYFREYEQTGFLDTYAEAQVYFGELLIKMGGKANKQEARRWLERAAQAPERFYAEWAERLLANLG
jgi:TPR repeat protein